MTYKTLCRQQYQGFQLLGIAWREKHRAQSARTHEWGPGPPSAYRFPGDVASRGKALDRVRGGQISHRFTSSFTNPSFQDLNGSHIMYWNMIIFKSVEVQGWTPLEILIFLHWTCKPTFTTLLGKRRAISHLMAVPKNRGKCKSATISLHRGDSLSVSAPPPNRGEGSKAAPPCVKKTLHLQISKYKISCPFPV